MIVPRKQITRQPSMQPPSSQLGQHSGLNTTSTKRARIPAVLTAVVATSAVTWAAFFTLVASAAALTEPTTVSAAAPAQAGPHTQRVEREMYTQQAAFAQGASQPAGFQLRATCARIGGHCKPASRPQQKEACPSSASCRMQTHAAIPLALAHRLCPLQRQQRPSWHPWHPPPPAGKQHGRRARPSAVPGRQTT